MPRPRTSDLEDAHHHGGRPMPMPTRAGGGGGRDRAARPMRRTGRSQKWPYHGALLKNGSCGGDAGGAGCSADGASPKPLATLVTNAEGSFRVACGKRQARNQAQRSQPLCHISLSSTVLAYPNLNVIDVRVIWTGFDDADAGADRRGQEAHGRGWTGGSCLAAAADVVRMRTRSTKLRWTRWLAPHRTNRCTFR
eukprot:351149-Chlamydomonas_euryale.AAC.4